jgi:hypothetical protein
VVAASLLAIYLGVSIPVGRATTVSFYRRSVDIRRMLESIVRQSRTEPGKMVLLKGVAPDLYWSGLYHRPLRLYGIDDVFLLTDHPAGAVQALRENRAVVYDLAGGEARDVTEACRMERCAGR